MVKSRSFVISYITFFFYNVSVSKNWSASKIHWIIRSKFIFLGTHSTQQTPLWEANPPYASREIPLILWNPKVHYRIQSARHLSLSWAWLIHPTYWRSILILLSHPRLGIQIDLFPSGFPSKTIYAPLLSPIRATCPANIVLLDLISQIIFGENSDRKAPRYVVSCPVTSSVLRPNIFFSTLFSNTLNLCSSLIVRDQVSQPYKTSGKTTFLNSQLNSRCKVLVNLLTLPLRSLLYAKRFSVLEWLILD